MFGFTPGRRQWSRYLYGLVFRPRGSTLAALKFNSQTWNKLEIVFTYLSSGSNRQIDFLHPGDYRRKYGTYQNTYVFIEKNKLRGKLTFQNYLLNFYFQRRYAFKTVYTKLFEME